MSGFLETAVLYGLTSVVLLLSALKDRAKTAAALKKAWKAFEGILPQFLTVLLLVAAMLALVDQDVISHVLGTESGPWGVLGAALVGAITLIPGFVAFPAAAALLREGAGPTQIAAFISSLMMVGVVTLPMEIRYFGKKASLMRNSFAFAFSLLAALFVGWMVSL
jgi:uncharacterized membrane protein YraQ (UPF0718 family)